MFCLFFFVLAPTSRFYRPVQNWETFRVTSEDFKASFFLFGEGEGSRWLNPTWEIRANKQENEHTGDQNETVNGLFGFDVPNRN